MEFMLSPSETVWRQANYHHVPRLCFINKMDRVELIFASVASIKSKLLANPLVLQLPMGSGSGSLVIPLLENPYQIVGIPSEYLELAKKRSELIESLADFDDSLMEKYLEGENISVEDLLPLIRKVTIAEKFVPILCGSAFKNIGIQPLLDAVNAYTC